MQQIETSQDIIDLSFLHRYKAAAMSVSGGLDSGTLLYLLAEEITQSNLNFPIYAITVPNRSDTACGHHAALVIEFVKSRFPNVEINHIIKSIIDGGNFKAKIATDIMREYFKQGLVDCYIDGVTKNPDSTFKFIEPNKDYVKRIFERDFNIQKIVETEDWLPKIRPFGGINKRGIYEITTKKGITEDLLSRTKSCTDTKEYKCMTCWWCQERKWGFNTDR